MNFSNYENAKAFMEKEKEHPVGLRSGPDRLTLKWAKRGSGAMPSKEGAKRW